MSVRVMADVWDFGPDDPIDNSVLLRLANHCNDQGKQCFPSVGEVAAKVRRSERTVIRSIAQLEADGWISVERGTGQGNTSHYIINVARLKECQAVTLSKDEGCQPRQQRVTPTTAKGDSGDNPPHPLLGITIIESSGNHQETIVAGATDAPFALTPNGTGKQTKPQKAKKANEEETDPRFVLFLKDLDTYWKNLPNHKDRSLPVGGDGGKFLKDFLKENPDVDQPTWWRWLENMFASEENINPAWNVRQIVTRISDYSDGPLNAFGKPLVLETKARMRGTA